MAFQKLLKYFNSITIVAFCRVPFEAAVLPINFIRESFKIIIIRNISIKIGCINLDDDTENLLVGKCKESPCQKKLSMKIIYKINRLILIMKQEEVLIKLITKSMCQP